MLPHFSSAYIRLKGSSPMSTRETGTEYERLRTQVEELNNALSRIVDVLTDKYLSEAERIERAVTVAEATRSTEEQFNLKVASR